MDFGRALITKVVDDENITKATRSGITSDFLDDSTIPVFRFLERHYGQYKTVSSRSAVKTAFPNFEFPEVQEPLEYYIDQIKESYRRQILEEKLERAAQIYTSDTHRAETLLREALSQLHITQKTFRDIDAAKTATDRLEAYRDRKQNPGADGILSGWGQLDYQTLGWHAEELIVLVGEKYMGKSWTMLWLAYIAALEGERVLFITKEMSQEAVVRRFDAIFAQICFDSLRRGELTNIEETIYAKAMEKMASSNLHFMVARQGVNTVADIETKAVETSATIVFGDSIYLFDADSGARTSNEVQRRMAISQRCKGIAQSLGIPFIVSVQAGRRKTKERIPTLDDIEWSNAFSQDADTVCFLNKEDVDKELKRAHMYLLKSREGQEVDFFIHQNFQTMDFSERSDETEPTTAVFTPDESTLFN